MQEARLRDLMDDLHASYKDREREARGERLAAGRDDELFSGGCRPLRSGLAFSVNMPANQCIQYEHANESLLSA